MSRDKCEFMAAIMARRKMSVALVGSHTFRRCSCAPSAFLFCLVLLTLCWSVVALPQPNVCVPLTVSMCSDMPYNQTSFPNPVGSEDQREAGVQLHTFAPLIAVECSPALRFFLCSVYVPMCTDKIAVPIGPCRPLCDAVRRRCEPMLAQFGFPWPPHLNCTQFPPENNARSMCMRGPPGAPDDDEPEEDAGRLTPRCPPPTLLYVNKTGACAYVCDDDVDGRLTSATWTRAQKDLASAVINAVRASVCLLAVLGSVSSLWRVRRHPLHYPERILLFLSLCFTAASVTQLVVQFNGADVLCTEYAGRRVLVTSGLPHVPCTTAAVLVYYASSAARVWWVLLCWACCLLTSGGWTRETVRLALNFRFQVLAWGVPMVLVVLALMAQAVDADSLTAGCSIGLQTAISERSARHLLHFLLLREAVTLLAGLPPLTLLALMLVRPRRSQSHDATGGSVLFRRLCCLGRNGTAVSNVTAPATASASSGTLCGLTAVCYLPVSAVLLCCYLYQYMTSASSDANLAQNSDVITGAAASFDPDANLAQNSDVIAGAAASFETALLRGVFELAYGVAVGVAWVASVNADAGACLCGLLRARRRMPAYATVKTTNGTGAYVCSGAATPATPLRLTPDADDELHRPRHSTPNDDEYR